MTTTSLRPLDVDARLRADVAHGRETLRTHAKSFRFAGMFLPARRLDDAAVVYAFCRAADDAVDEAPSAMQAQQQARALHDELTGEAPPRAEVRAFLDVAQRIGLDVRYALELVRGMAFDAAGTVRIHSDEQLVEYCYCAAGTVGGMMCAVLGVRDPRALPFAIDLGIAMQLTNICRDVLEDAHRDRCYLPAARLASAGLPPSFVHAVIGGVASRSDTGRVVRALLDLAERYYASAELGMRFIPLRSRFAILVAARVYRAIGVKLRARACDPLSGRVSTTTGEKIGSAMGAIARLLSRRVLGLVPAEHDEELHRGLANLPGTHAPRASTRDGTPRILSSARSTADARQTV